MKKRFLLLGVALTFSKFCLAAELSTVKVTNMVITAEMRARLPEVQGEKVQNLEKQQVAWKQWFENLRPYNVYGKVLDDSGNPVESVKIEEQHTDHSGFNVLGKIVTKWYITDKNGEFVIKMEAGESDPSLFSVEREGYEFNSDYSPYYSKKQTGTNNPLLSTSKEHPVVLTLRKKGAITFFLGNEDFEFQFLMGESGETKGYDFVQKRMIKDMTRPVFNNKALVCDLQTTATFSTNNSAWTVVMKPGNANGGIMASDKMLHEAPQEGYQAEFTFVAEDRKVQKKCIYLKSRNASIFTRLDIKYIIANNEFFRIGAKVITNPYGDRNLEAATDVPYEVRKQLIDKAKAAHRQGKHPEKPDLPKLIKEAKDKAEKGKQ